MAGGNTAIIFKFLKPDAKNYYPKQAKFNNFSFSLEKYCIQKYYVKQVCFCRKV